MNNIRKSNAIRCAVSGIALLVPALMLANTAPLTGDTYINPGSAGNFGALPGINLGGAAGAEGLLLFDLTKLPAGATGNQVVSATLRVFVNKVTFSGAIDLFAANAPWTEATVNGVTAPVPGPGAIIQSGIPVSSADQYIDVNVTAQVALWLNGGANDGFIFTAESSTSIVLDSKESGATSHPATLEILLTGAQGAMGSAGPAGPPGLNGPAGAPGSQGPAGAPGPAGTPGPTGPTGPTGAIGLAGPTGVAGATGSLGAPGATGPTGPLGPVGFPGPAGSAGAQGPAGPAGAVGPTGPAGSAGATGAVGATGGTGAAGLTGPPGMTGPTGAAGPSGPGGAAGSQGPAGSRGPMGSAGAQGAAGAAFSNSWSVEGPVSSGAVISAGDVNRAILVTNTSAATVTLPLANSASGKQILIQAAVNYNGSNTITINVQGGDHILNHNSNSPTGDGQATTCTVVNTAEFVSDGVSRWYLTQFFQNGAANACDNQ
jgi:collagen triple helix repeat protein